MSIPESVLPLFRANWASRFVDTVVVKRETSVLFNDTTGVTTPSYTNQFSGSGLVRPMTRRDAEIGEQVAAVGRYDVFIPYDETDPQPGDYVDVSATADGYLNGKTLTVTGIRADSYNTVRVLECEENQDV